MRQRARLIVLVGPKGSGKTTLGRFLDAEAGVHFLEVEVIAKRVLDETGGVVDEHYAERAFAAIVRGVESISEEHRVVVIETTGASQHSPGFFEALGRDHRVHLVRVRARVETCARRIAERDSSRQVEISPDLVEKMHARTEALDLDWAVEVDNDPPITRARLLELLGHLLKDSA